MSTSMLYTFAFPILVRSRNEQRKCSAMMGIMPVSSWKRMRCVYSSGVIINDYSPSSTTNKVNNNCHNVGRDCFVVV